MLGAQCLRHSANIKRSNTMIAATLGILVLLFAIFVVLVKIEVCLEDIESKLEEK